MISKEQALSLGYGDIIHFTGQHSCWRAVGPRGGVKEGIVRARVNGVCKTWKRDPNRFYLPVKHGMRDYGAITNTWNASWHLESECPVLGRVEQ